VAFIEKTPRVRVGLWTSADTDWRNWEQGPKGDTEYGLNHDSRVWCNRQLVELGYELPDLTRESITYENADDDLEYLDMELCETLSKNNLNSNSYQETEPPVCLLCQHMYQSCAEDVLTCTLARVSDKWNYPHVHELGTCDKFERRT
jgi:hypothetical protein